MVSGVALLVGLGCATTDSPTPQLSATQAGRIVYPPPPAEPVIEWLASVSKRSDIDPGRGRLKKLLVGEEEREPSLVAPTALALGPGNVLYVVDQELDAVVIIDSEKKRFDFFTGEGSGRLENPVGVAVSEDGSLYVSDPPSQAIYVYDSERTFRAAFGGPHLFTHPTGLAISADGKRLAVCDTKAHKVVILDAATGEKLVTLGGKQGDGEGQFSHPVAAAFDQEGYLYVSDYLNFRIQIFDPSGDPELTFGQVGDRAGDLNRPRGLAADSTARVIYEVDGAFELVQLFNLDGELLMWFGGPGKSPGRFSLPSGIARRGEQLAIADTLNSRVQLFRFLGVPRRH